MENKEYFDGFRKEVEEKLDAFLARPKEEQIHEMMIATHSVTSYRFIVDRYRDIMLKMYDNKDITGVARYMSDPLHKAIASTVETWVELSKYLNENKNETKKDE